MLERFHFDESQFTPNIRKIGVKAGPVVIPVSLDPSSFHKMHALAGLHRQEGAWREVKANYRASVRQNCLHFPSKLARALENPITIIIDRPDGMIQDW